MRCWRILAIAMIVLTGCWNPFGSGGGGGGGGNGDDINREKPENLVDFLAFAYERREIDKYEAALDDRFLFEFTEDIADSLNLPPDAPWWGKEEDVRSTENMFEDPQVTKIVMDLSNMIDDWDPIYEVRPREGGGVDSIPAFVARFEPLIIVTIEKPGEEPMNLEVRDSWLDIWATQDPNYEGLWTILRIKEIKKP